MRHACPFLSLSLQLNRPNHSRCSIRVQVQDSVLPWLDPFEDYVFDPVRLVVSLCNDTRNDPNPKLVLLHLVPDILYYQ